MKNIFSAASGVFVNSDCKASFCGCKGVLKYTDTEIVLQMREMSVLTEGSDLTLSTYVGGETVITGRIKGLKFIRKGKGAEGDK